MYCIYLVPWFGTGLDEESSLDLAEEGSRLFGGHLTLLLEVTFWGKEEDNNFLMGVFFDFLHPVSELLKGIERVDGVDKENGRNAFVEGPDDSLEQFLTCLFRPTSTVSQICNLTCVWFSTCTILEEY